MSDAHGRPPSPPSASGLAPPASPSTQACLHSTELIANQPQGPAAAADDDDTAPTAVSTPRNVRHAPNCYPSAHRLTLLPPSMLSRRIAAARPLGRALAPVARPQFALAMQRRTALTAAESIELADPNQNGGYINPAPEKRSQRDPYADYFDQQDRRNYGEPCHEDHDILGVLSLHEYDHFSPGWGAVLLGTFVATVFGLCAAVGTIYPDKISVPKTYPDGLEAELGGKGAVPGGAWLSLSSCNTDCFSGQEARPGLGDPVMQSPWYIYKTSNSISYVMSCLGCCDVSPSAYYLQACVLTVLPSPRAEHNLH